MNKDYLNELINRYEDNLDMLYGTEHDELFKWIAMKTWREEWFKPADAFASFADRFNAARRDFSLFIDNSRMHPSSGVIKLWEREPGEVERLFIDVLLADPHGDVTAVHTNMDRFLEGYEALLRRHFPGNWSFQQDRHSASVYLAMNDPGFNFVFKAKEAQKMAKYVEFGFDIGAGTSFSLPNYYLLCDEIVAALREHESLLTKHFERLRPEHYRDDSLHLLAFDLMYCSRAYNFYHGLAEPTTGRTVRKKPAAPETPPEELALREAERLAKIGELERQIEELELGCDEYSDISLTGVRVTSPKYGEGTVIEQDINKIRVRFAEIEKTFVLDNRFAGRPRFEDDEDIVAAFTEYGRIQEKINGLKKELNSLDPPTK